MSLFYVICMILLGLTIAFGGEVMGAAFWACVGILAILGVGELIKDHRRR